MYKENTFLVSWVTKDGKRECKSFDTRDEAIRFGFDVVDLDDHVADWDVYISISEFDMAQDEITDMKEKLVKAAQVLNPSGEKLW